MNILTVSYIEILRQSSVFYMNIHIYIRVYMNIHIYIRIYMNIHIYIRIYIYMNILTQLREESIYSSRGGDILLDFSFRRDLWHMQKRPMAYAKETYGICKKDLWHILSAFEAPRIPGKKKVVYWRSKCTYVFIYPYVFSSIYIFIYPHVFI